MQKAGIVRSWPNDPDMPLFPLIKCLGTQYDRTIVPLTLIGPKGTMGAANTPAEFNKKNSSGIIDFERRFMTIKIPINHDF